MTLLRFLRSGPILISVAALVVAVATFLWQPVWLFHWHDIKAGDEIISKVETFRANHGRLPDTLMEIRVRDPELGVFYKKTGDDAYLVWFGTTLGESEVYNSQTKKWE